MPDAGGVHDQDYTLMQRMAALQNVYRAVQRLRSSQGAEIHSLTDSERRVIRYLMDQKILR